VAKVHCAVLWCTMPHCTSFLAARSLRAERFAKPLDACCLLAGLCRLGGSSPPLHLCCWFLTCCWWQGAVQVTRYTHTMQYHAIPQCQHLPAFVFKKGRHQCCGTSVAAVAWHLARHLTLRAMLACFCACPCLPACPIAALPARSPICCTYSGVFSRVMTMFTGGDELEVGSCSAVLCCAVPCWWCVCS
jgi:hypothetical protein